MGESADAVWANLAHERAQMFAQAPTLVTEEQEEPAADSNIQLVESGAFAFDAAEEEEASEVEEAEPLPEMAKPFLVPPLYLSPYLNQHQHPHRKPTFLRSMRCVQKPPAASQLWRMRSRCCCSADSASSNERAACALKSVCRYTQITIRSEATIVLIIKNLIIKFLINRFGRRTLTFLRSRSEHGNDITAVRP